MGSNNVVVLDGSGTRVGAPVEVGEGPTGIVLHESLQRAYVLKYFIAHFIHRMMDEEAVLRWNKLALIQEDTEDDAQAPRDPWHTERAQRARRNA